jgi:hypothetical protein
MIITAQTEEDLKDLTTLFDVALKAGGIQMIGLINKLNETIVNELPGQGPTLSASDDKKVEETVAPE